MASYSGLHLFALTCLVCILSGSPNLPKHFESTVFSRSSRPSSHKTSVYLNEQPERTRGALEFAITKKLKNLAHTFPSTLNKQANTEIQLWAQDNQKMKQTDSAGLHIMDSKHLRHSHRRRPKIPKPLAVTEHFGHPSTPPGSDCPVSCHCKYRPDKMLDVVDCSSRGLTAIPKLPSTTREVHLQNNKITAIPCTAFSNLRILVKLDVSGNVIDTLYNCSFHYSTSLKSLWISQNNLTLLPVGLFESMGDLLELDLSRNKIRKLNLFLFINMSQLKTLNLSTNKLTQVRNDTFLGLRSLIYLSLQGNLLRYLPGTFETKAFQGLSTLESLHLEGNQPDLLDNFTYPDQALAQILTLQRLWLDGYPRPLGPGFSSLVQLTHLNFANGGMCAMYSDMPQDFFNHVASEKPLHINMSACNFREIPPVLFKSIPTIHSLDLSHNDYLRMDGFEKASEGLQNSSLAVLNISDIVNSRVTDSEIKNTSFRFLKHTRLKVLVVEDCDLLYINPQAILDLPQTLEYLSVEDNKLANPDALFSTLHLTNLKIEKASKQLHSRIEKGLGFHRAFLSSDDNRIESSLRAVNGNISDKAPYKYQQDFIPSLRDSNIFQKSETIVDIHQAKSTVKSDFCGDKHSVYIFSLPPKLEEAYASDIKVTNNIPIVHIFNNKVLKHFDYSANVIKCFGGPVYGVPSIQHVDLSRNWCFQLNPQFFSHMPSLKTLLLYKNMLGRALADDAQGITFSSLPNLEILDLNSNVIEDLPVLTFERNENLRILNLSNNEMNHFLPSLANNKKLETLDLSSNLLEGLSQSTCQHLLSIKERNPNFTVRIHRNKFTCDCNNIHFINFLLDQPMIFEDVSTFSCRMANGSHISYDRLPQLAPLLGVQCIAQVIFVGVLFSFFLVIGSLAVFVLYRFKRWQWRYLYYVSRSRLHIGSTHTTYRPRTHAFLTYDQVRRREIDR